MANLRFCSLKTCSSKSSDSVSFFTLPKNESTRTYWFKFFKENGFSNPENFSNLKLCEKHFYIEDITFHKGFKRLKTGAVPINGVVNNKNSQKIKFCKKIF